MEVEEVKKAFLSSEPSGVVCLREKRPSPAAHRRRGKRAVEGADAARSGSCVGVFAARRIQVDEDLGEYGGELTRLSAGANLSRFAFQLNDRVAVDPAQLNGSHQDPVRLSQACIIHFVDQPQPHQRCTARFMIDPESSRVTLRSIVEIEDGEEVLASYGGCRPGAEQHAVNDVQCSRFAPVVKLTRAEQQRLSLTSNLAAVGCDFAVDAACLDAGKGSTAAVQVRVVQRVVPVVRRRLVKPAGASRPRTIDRWTREEIEELAGFILRSGIGQWEKKVAALTTSLAGVTRTAAAAAYVWHTKLKSQPRFAHLLESGSVRADGTAIGWSDKERQALIDLIADRGASSKDWDEKAKLLGTGRTANAVKQYYHKNIRSPQQQVRSEAVAKLVVPPEILDMKAENGRKVYLTTLQPPKYSSRGRRRKSTAKNQDLVKANANAATDAPEAKWWATAEELIERVGTESAEAMITKLIEFANNHCASGVESEESDEEVPANQNSWNYKAWKTEQPPSQLQHCSQHRTQTQRVQQVQSTQLPGTATAEHSCDDDDNDDVPVSTLAAGLSTASPSYLHAGLITPAVTHKRRVWTNEELNKLAELVEECGEGDWDTKAVALGTGRTAKSLEMKYYSLQISHPVRQGRGSAEVEDTNKIQNSGEAGGGGSTETGTASAASLPEGAWRSADDATAATKCEAMQISTHAFNLVEGHDVSPATKPEAGNASNEEFSQPAQEEEKTNLQDHEQPNGGVVDEIDAEMGTARSGVDKDNCNGEQNENDEENGEKQAEFEEHEPEKREEQEKRKESAKNVEPTSSETSRPTTAMVVSSAQSREGLLAISTRTTGASTPSEPASPPLSRIGFQSLLSDSDSPEVLDGSPSPLVDTETSVDSDTPAPVATDQLPASASDSVQPRVAETEAVGSNSSSYALATASAAQHAGDKQISWKARKLHLNEINTHSNLDRTSTVLAARAETATVAETHSNVPDCPSAIASSSARRRGSNAHEASQKTQMVPKQAERGQSNRRVQQDASRMRDHGEDDHIEAVAAATAALTASVVARDVSGGEVVKKAETGAIRAKEREPKNERGADSPPDQNQAFARRQLARRERKKPAAWWDAQTHEPVLKRAKVSHHSTRGSPPLGSQTRRGSGMKVRLPEADSDDTQQAVIER